MSKGLVLEPTMKFLEEAVQSLRQRMTEQRDLKQVYAQGIDSVDETMIELKKMLPSLLENKNEGSTVYTEADFEHILLDGLQKKILTLNSQISADHELKNEYGCDMDTIVSIMIDVQEVIGSFF